MSAPRITRGRSSVLLAGLCLPAAGLVLLPSAALAVDSGPSTVQATIDPGGAVKGTTTIASGGGVSKYAGTLPLTTKITSAVSGGVRTTSYEVSNTSGKQQTVSWTDPASTATGKAKQRHAQSDVQLPLVGQLTVTLPPSAKDVQAPGAAVSTSTNGAHTLVWSLVLFSPLGAPTQDVSFTSTGSGAPVATLRATSVSPTSTPGLSTAAQDANQSEEQTGVWDAEASGADTGLSQLASGIGSLVSGLKQLSTGANQLHTGLAPALTGAKQLDAGAHQALAGSQSLSTGLGKIHSGQSSLTKGLTKIHTGQSSLTGGLGKIHSGQSSLTTGLGQISGGLKQLADPKTGLPSAVTGAEQLKAGADQLLAGVGDDATAGTLLNGVDQLAAGVGALTSAFTTGDGTAANPGINATVGCTYLAIEAIVHGNGASPTAQEAACGIPGGITADSDPYVQGLLADNAYGGGLGLVYQGLTSTNPATGVLGGLGAIGAGLAQVRTGLSNPGSASSPGIKEGLQAVDAGLGQLVTGLQAANGGIGQLAPGAASALAGSEQLTAGSKSALAGSRKLTTGSASALSGSKQLTAGSGSAFNGSRALALGLGKIAAGEHQSAVGLPAAITGSGQIAAGLTSAFSGSKQIQAGIGQVKDTAVHPLAGQLSGAGDTARQQIAVLTASGTRASQSGDTNRTYVLTQSPDALRLAADSTPASSSSGSHTGRDVLIACLVGVVALALGGLGGLALGRGRGAGA